MRTAVALAIILLAPSLVSCRDSDEPATQISPASSAELQLTTAFGSMDKLPGVLRSPPPWSANREQLQARLRAIGLPALTAEGQVVHIHQHLDVFVDGEKVEIPANIGIGRAFISPLHTHEDVPSIILVLAEHQQIVLAYGTSAQMPKDVPSSYDFEASGL